jgi:acyl-CoA synthetase (AMP-forming)/AMP-acid ligase II
MRHIDFFDRGAELHPERDVIRYEGRSWTYREMQDLTHRVAAGLLAAGLGREDVAATFTPNHPLGFAAQYGIFRAGVRWTPTNARNSVFDNVEVLTSIGARFLFFHSSLAAEAEQLMDRVPSLQRAVCLDTELEGIPSLDSWMPIDTTAVHAVVWEPDDVVAVCPTSGTSGRPKGVMLTNRNFEMMAANFQSLMHYEDPIVNLVVAPLTHAAGYFGFTLLSQGAVNVLLPSTDPQLILESIENHRATTLFLPPTLIYMLLAHPRLRDYDYSSLRYLLYGGSPMSVEKLQQAMEVFGPVLACPFGQTEVPVIISFLSPAEHADALADPTLRHRLASVGRPAPFVQVGIMSDEGKLLGPDERGEIVVRGGVVMNGYLNAPEENQRVSEFGWHHTGDVGTRDADGYLYVVDRKKNMIISGGFNVYPAEVEQAIWAYPAIQDCAVIGTPDDKWGEAVTAVVQLKPGVEFDEADFMRHCRERLGGVKMPKKVVVRDSLPKTATGKVLKRVIRDEFWPATGAIDSTRDNIAASADS